MNVIINPLLSPSIAIMPSSPIMVDSPENKLPNDIFSFKKEKNGLSSTVVYMSINRLNVVTDTIDTIIPDFNPSK